jgi:LPXTG-motif cell wall-anchored protein
MSSAITYNKDTTIDFYDDESNAKNATGTPAVSWSASSGKFTTTYNTGTNSMTVALTTSGLAEINPSLESKYMVVKYTATIKSDDTVVLGDSGDPNDVTLTYSRTNSNEENTIKDRANVYKYGIDLTKTFAGSDGVPTDVEFVLQNSTDNYYVTAKSSTSGVYYITDATHAATEDKATVFSPDSAGKLVINGLEADTYVLTEIHTSEGYTLLKAPITIAITGTVDTIVPSKATVTGITNPNADIIYTTGDRAYVTVDGSKATMAAQNTSTNAYAVMTVVNNHDFTLPMTGGFGTFMITLIGSVVFMIGLSYIMRRRRAARG